MAVDGSEGRRGGGEGAGHVGGVGVRGLSRHGADGHVDHLLVFVDLSAGHARLGGSALEMCFGGDCDCEMDVRADTSVMEFLFNEEMGLVVDDAEVLTAYEAVQWYVDGIAKT